MVLQLFLTFWLAVVVIMPNVIIDSVGPPMAVKTTNAAGTIALMFPTK